MLTSNGEVDVGMDGFGTFVQSGGTYNATNILYVAKNAASRGSYTLSGGTLAINTLVNNGGFPRQRRRRLLGTVNGTGSLVVNGTADVERHLCAAADAHRRRQCDAHRASERIGRERQPRYQLVLDVARRRHARPERQRPDHLAGIVEQRRRTDRQRPQRRRWWNQPGLTSSAARAQPRRHNELERDGGTGLTSYTAVSGQPMFTTSPSWIRPTCS